MTQDNGLDTPNINAELWYRRPNISADVLLTSLRIAVFVLPKRASATWNNLEDVKARVDLCEQHLESLINKLLGVK